MNLPVSRPLHRAELPEHIRLVARALFESDGYAPVTMELIAREAGVSKRTLYKHFPAKEALLEQLLEATLAQDLSRRDWRGAAGDTFRGHVTALLQESAKWCEQHRGHLLPYIRYKFATFDPGAAPVSDNSLLGAWTRLIAAAQERGELTTHCPADQLGVYFHYLYLGALMRWLMQPQLDLRQEFETVLALFVNGAAPSRRSLQGHGVIPRQGVGPSP